MTNLPYSNKFKFGIFGPAIILLAFGQATGELIHWPYLAVRYQYYFLYLLIPACIMQYPILYFLGRHTVISGESYLSLLTKSQKSFAILTWVVFFITTIWISSYTNSGGIGIVKFANKFFNLSLDEKSWGDYIAICINTIFFAVLVFSKRGTYQIVSRSMQVIALLSFSSFVVLTVFAIFEKPFDTGFLPSLLDIKLRMPDNWIKADMKIVVSAVVFAGLGGLWNLLYSGWVRNQKMGMAAANDDDFIDYQSELPEIEDSDSNRSNLSKTLKLLNTDLIIGIILNFLMLLMLIYVCIAFWPFGKIPSPVGLSIITVLADAASYVEFIGFIFYLFIGLFLIDTWLTAADALSKVHANFFLSFQKESPDTKDQSRKIYFFFLMFMWIMTLVTSFLAQPQTFLYLNGILSSIGSVLLVVGIFINESYISRKATWLSASKIQRMLLLLSLVFYLSFVVLYFSN